MNQSEREVREVFGVFKMYDGRRAREVLASYDDGPTRREIEVAVDEEYTPHYARIED